jgi:hypothetical protein
MTTADEVLQLAREQTGLHDLDSDSWRAGLEIILEEIEDPRQSDGGRGMVLDRSVKALANRLRVVDYVREHPEVRDEVIDRPLFILGMPRTGTTVASYLLAQDPARRSLLKWEAGDTVPPATTETLRTDPRCLKLLEEDKFILELIAQSGRAIPHWEDADGPTEDMFLHEQDFKGLLWDSFTPSDRYAEWIVGEADVTSAYEYQKLVLQVLQSKAPGRWSLKMPSHSVHIETLLAVFPDAQLVWAHRDPYTATGSLCNLLRLPASMTLTEDGFDPAYLGQNAKHQMREHVMRPLAVRDRLGDDRFFHLHYADLVSDPLATMRALYDWSGDDLSPETEAAMQAWLADNPQHKLGKAQYTLDEYGLSVDELEPVFAEYLAAIPVELDGSG